MNGVCYQGGCDVSAVTRACCVLVIAGTSPRASAFVVGARGAGAAGTLHGSHGAGWADTGNGWVSMDALGCVGGNARRTCGMHGSRVKHAHVPWWTINGRALTGEGLLPVFLLCQCANVPLAGGPIKTDSGQWAKRGGGDQRSIRTS